MYTMKQACEMSGLPYETLKFYCNEGLVPNVARDGANRRIFTDENIFWIKSLVCMKNCGMGIETMRRYLSIEMSSEAGIRERKAVLDAQRAELERRVAALRDSIDYIDRKQEFYDDLLAGRQPSMEKIIASVEKQTGKVG